VATRSCDWERIDNVSTDAEMDTIGHEGVDVADENVDLATGPQVAPAEDDVSDRAVAFDDDAANVADDVVVIAEDVTAATDLGASGGDRVVDRRWQGRQPAQRSLGEECAGLY